MTTAEILAKTEKFAKETLNVSESAHDWWHIHRVYTLAMEMAKQMQADELIVGIAALLHDHCDSKFIAENHDNCYAIITNFLNDLPLTDQQRSEILYIIKNMSFSDSFGEEKQKSIAFQVVQDADRLDAIGAIGIARAFSYGGFRKRAFYDPEIPVQIHETGKSYKNSKAPTINHFYEKLLLLKDQMNTEIGKQKAQIRHDFMLNYLQQFADEWDGIK